MQRGSVNKVIIVGHVGGDPEPRYTPSGTAVVNISVATNEVRRDSEGNELKSTEWHRVVLWSKQAEFVGNYVKKGQLVYVEGRLQTRTWEDRNKIERRTTEIVADNITLLGPSRSTDSPATDTPSISEEPPDDDDIPF
ncbi:MAG: single-stranded DNA-binding protein [Candidatus Marinimicrobia bacterium]|nr:single-stranded DNA-binding protein [Candidatus Neomarinimicrobiota bacterium]